METTLLYRSSMCDLNTCTFFLAMMARRTGRMGAALLPLNITPAITSIHPLRIGPAKVVWSVTRRAGVTDRDRACPVAAEISRAVAQRGRHGRRVRRDRAPGGRVRAPDGRGPRGRQRAGRECSHR